MFKYFLRNSFIFLIYSWFYIPIIILIINSFNLSNFGNQWQGFSFKWYYYIINNSFLIEATYHSLTIAIISATFATIMGFLTAITLYYCNLYIKSFISILLFIVIVSPDIIMAISLLLLFILLNFTLGFWTLLFSHITFCIPYVVITIYSRLKNFDNRIIEAAKDLGASDNIIITKIILPLMLPAILSSWLLSFTLSMDDITISTFVTGPTYEILPLKIYSMVKIGVSPEINALATILIIISLLLFLISRIILKKFYKNYYQINYIKNFK
ncbi:spermidine/putrescine ABC transporter permease PotC [Enterobacteriaceae endosymbiont of Plateumaris braccata]|uniref:spermidine/putrescine ABC transporter permease PotC n=1 Tax=Enterobacteriaceae endosymbiont of Plateumaris braccata TaxID=2675793 RepID=UPI001449FF3E|nr:spermidine/putrescine ABC transporter permease PotC [Enterobacteriaceae endosymbiont of Plateumaris braccata]QJC28383.1 spermidine/putrescine ABC transporter permease PotC [Enterobacteriaceae endosymbiont of Plateumaris braccata]